MNKSILSRARSRLARQAGAAAVELAIVLSVSIVLLPAVALFAKLFFQYSVIKEATRDAAAYLGTEAEGSIRDPGEMARAQDVARQIVIDAAAGSGLTSATSNNELSPVVVTCDDNACLGPPPDRYDVRVSFGIEDGLFAGLTGSWTDGDHKWRVSVKSSMPNTN